MRDDNPRSLETSVDRKTPCDDKTHSLISLERFVSRVPCRFKALFVFSFIHFGLGASPQEIIRFSSTWNISHFFSTALNHQVRNTEKVVIPPFMGEHFCCSWMSPIYFPILITNIYINNIINNRYMQWG